MYAIAGKVKESLLLLVIPAQAGTHFDFPRLQNTRIKMGPSLRWDDGKVDRALQNHPAASPLRICARRHASGLCVACPLPFSGARCAR